MSKNLILLMLPEAQLAEKSVRLLDFLALQDPEINALSVKIGPGITILQAPMRYYGIIIEAFLAVYSPDLQEGF